MGIETVKIYFSNRELYGIIQCLMRCGMLVARTLLMCYELWKMFRSRTENVL